MKKILFFLKKWFVDLIFESIKAGLIFVLLALLFTFIIIFFTFFLPGLVLFKFLKFLRSTEAV